MDAGRGGWARAGKAGLRRGGGRAAGWARSLAPRLSRARSEAGVRRGVVRGGKLTKHDALGGVRPGSKGGPRSATTSRSCVGEGGRMVSVLWGIVSTTCGAFSGASEKGVVGGTRSEASGSERARGR